jgi:hypothetical protein
MLKSLSIITQITGEEMAVDIKTNAALAIQHMEAAINFSYPGSNRSLTDGIEKLQSARRCIEAIQKVRDLGTVGKDTIIGNVDHAINAFKSGDEVRLEINRSTLTSAISVLKPLSQ